jgi:hypothetical protein
MAEVHGNRTHRAHLPVNTTGFEVQASHRARFTSVTAAIVAESKSRLNHKESEALQPGDTGWDSTWANIVPAARTTPGKDRQ